MKRTDVTYGQLDKVLRSLGFSRRELKKDPATRVYEHKSGALITIPPFPESDFVLDYHLVGAERRSTCSASRTRKSSTPIFRMRGEAAGEHGQALTCGASCFSMCESKTSQPLSHCQRDTMDIEKELAGVAQQYRSEGYAVVTHPDADHLPGFAKDFGVDLLATRGDERLLVQVEEDRESLKADPSVSRLAELVSKHPEWRYDVIVLNRSDPIQRITRGAREPSNEEMERSLQHVEALLQAGDSRAALVFAWAALEAAMRQTASSVGLYTPRTSPAELIQTLYGNGLLTWEEFEVLRDSYRVRTEIVHGLVSPPITPDHVRAVVGVVRRLLTEKTEAKSVAG